MTQPRLHHVGFVVAAISSTAAALARVLSLDWDGRIIHDPLQLVKVTFLPSKMSDGGGIELVEAVGRRSPVRAFAERGGGLHHVCYEVDDLRAQIVNSQEAGGTLVRVPLPAVAFAGREIAWILTRERLLVEFLEKKSVIDPVRGEDPPTRLPLAVAT